jgi:hypothetical protein
MDKAAIGAFAVESLHKEAAFRDVETVYQGPPVREVQPWLGKGVAPNPAQALMQVSSRGVAVVPASVRDAAGFNPGASLLAEATTDSRTGQSVIVIRQGALVVPTAPVEGESPEPPAPSAPPVNPLLAMLQAPPRKPEEIAPPGIVSLFAEEDAADDAARDAKILAMFTQGGEV